MLSLSGLAFRLLARKIEVYMSEIKYAICCASYSIGNATEYSGILWIGDDHWVTEFEDADLFDGSTTDFCKPSLESMI